MMHLQANTQRIAWILNPLLRKIFSMRSPMFDNPTVCALQPGAQNDCVCVYCLGMDSVSIILEISLQCR
jgi:hypothetical protein